MRFTKPTKELYWFVDTIKISLSTDPTYKGSNTIYFKCIQAIFDPIFIRYKFIMHLHTHNGTNMRFLIFQLFEQKGGIFEIYLMREFDIGLLVGFQYFQTTIYMDESHTAIITPNISIQCIQMK